MPFNSIKDILETGSQRLLKPSKYSFNSIKDIHEAPHLPSGQGWGAFNSIKDILNTDLIAILPWI